MASRRVIVDCTPWGRLRTMTFATSPRRSSHIEEEAGSIMYREWNGQRRHPTACSGRDRLLAPTAHACDIAIRRGEAADVVCIAALGIQVFLDTYATEGIRGSVAREAIETLSPAAVGELLGRPATTFLLAEANGNLIGFAQLNACVEHELVPFSAPAELKRLYVQERFTGRGIGARLLGCVEAVAFDDGASAIWATAWSGNVRALRFYARQGYAVLASTLFAVEDEEYENKLLAKPLGAAR